MKTASITACLAAAAVAAMLFQTASADEAAATNIAAASMVGQKLDSGLGDLPHYRYWTDKTGKTPLGADTVAVLAIDSGARR